jgi:hypothetical protein
VEIGSSNESLLVKEREIDYCKNSLIIRKIFFRENIFGEKIFLKNIFWYLARTKIQLYIFKLY